MNERVINAAQLTQSALGVVARLEQVAANRERTYPSQIEAVLVFSGPGTYKERLKPSQRDPNAKTDDEIDKDNKTNPVRWMDRDRIRAGVAVVRDVNARRLSNNLGKRISTKSVSDGDILNNGPFLVYNGIPVENKVFREVLELPTTKIPKEKVVIIDEVRRPDRVLPIAHTGHQVESFFQEVANPFSPLHNIINVALIAHVSDFARNLFYIKKYNSLHAASGNDPINFWVYAIKNRPGTQQILVESEIARVIAYALKGDLATEPAPFNT